MSNQGNRSRLLAEILTHTDFAGGAEATRLTIQHINAAFQNGRFLGLLRGLLSGILLGLILGILLGAYLQRHAPARKWCYEDESFCVEIPYGIRPGWASTHTSNTPPGLVKQEVH